ncbi:hypothetical protein HCG49_05685 [Arenibacter sp. 6A1]|uniref:HYC_CC_PP family protein n=1 Tax=Arenibacter sp. 6A1 TaxID=2720391 RepID=UPI0014488C4B|nr:hypothetical protein [Arenibacter sp. 6A1]NKI26046.1 hypothetical protein [Arenibacter sp. 6A1]
MKGKAFRILASVMAFLMLLSSVSWTIEKHYCMGSLIDVAFFHKPDSCGVPLSDSNVSQTVIRDLNACCSNEIINIPGQEELKLSSGSFDLDQQVFLSAFVFSYYNLFKVASERLVPFNDYQPPMVVKDICVLDQVFLI